MTGAHDHPPQNDLAKSAASPPVPVDGASVAAPSVLPLTSATVASARAAAAAARARVRATARTRNGASARATAGATDAAPRATATGSASAGAAAASSGARCPSAARATLAAGIVELHAAAPRTRTSMPTGIRACVVRQKSIEALVAPESIQRSRFLLRRAKGVRLRRLANAGQGRLAANARSHHDRRISSARTAPVVCAGRRRRLRSGGPVAPPPSSPPRPGPGPESASGQVRRRFRLGLAYWL